MKIEKEVIEALNKEIDKQGVSAVFIDSGLNYRTVIRMTNSGECHRPQYKKLIKYLRKQKNKRNALIESFVD